MYPELSPYTTRGLLGELASSLRSSRLLAKRLKLTPSDDIPRIFFVCVEIVDPIWSLS